MEMKETADFLTSLMRQAGKRIVAAHVDNDEGDSVKVKPGTANFVTVHDVAVQDFLIGEIRKNIPEAVFIAEEKENDSSLLSGARCFIIDPIDGTTNFIHDYRHSCISLAMLEGGKTVFGAVYDPYLDEMFCAVSGEGATLNGKPMRVSDCPPPLAVAAFGTAPYYKDELADKTFALAKELFLSMSDVRRSGSAALDLAYVAAGRVDAFFEWRLSPWDFAAGTLLVTEAGGMITSGTGGTPDITAPCSIFAGNAMTHPVLLEIAQKYGV